MALVSYTCYWRAQDHSRKTALAQIVPELPSLSLSLPPLSRHSDMVKVKQVFKRMLAEPHAKVCYSLLELAAVSSWMQLSFNINPMNNHLFL